MQKYTIDAQDKRIGRVASEAASALMGKNTTSFARHLLSGTRVEITNASKLAIQPKKLTQKVYTRYSGHPSGLKRERMEEVIDRHGHSELIRRAVYGMLPANKLRSRMMKQLTISE